jgi:hypothetical protein
MRQVFGRNPTNVVGGLFIRGLHGKLDEGSRIPPTQLVDRSYPSCPDWPESEPEES